MDAIKISTARIVFALFGLASIASAQTPPSFAALTPASGSAQYGTAQSFAFTFSDAAGTSDIIQAQIGFGSTSTTAGCMVNAAPNGTVNLWNDAGSAFSSGTVGTGVLSNSQCSVNLAASTIGASGTFLINLSVTFTAAYAGTREIYVTAAGSAGGSSPWTIAGAWNVTTQMTVSATPATGTGTSQTLTVTANDPSGVSDIYSLQVIVGGSPTAAGSCYIYVFPNANTNNEGYPANSIWLATDSGGWSSPGTLGSVATLSNSQCSVSVQNSSGVTSGSNYTLTLAVNYTSSYAGPQTAFALTNSIHNIAWNTGWVAASQWNVPTNVLSQPQSATPNTGNLASQMFTFTYQDTATGGTADFRAVMVKFGSTTADAGSCYVWVNPNPGQTQFPANAVWLLNDAANNWGANSNTLGSAVTLSNSQCSISLAQSSAAYVSNSMTLTLAVTFLPAYAGPKNIYAMAESLAASGTSSGWLQQGTWNVPSGILTQSVAQSNPGNASQTLTFTYTDPRGAADLKSAQALIATGVSGVSACYIWVNPNANQPPYPTNSIWLLNDTGGSWGSYQTLGTPGTLSNSQCSVNVGASLGTANGTSYTLKLVVTYTSPHTAASENLYGTMTDAIGDAPPWQLLDVWKMPVPAIASISPNPGVTGATVTITGTNFGQNGGTVTFNGLTASAVWGPASITATVPAALTTGNVAVVVTSALGLASNAFNFPVIPPPPTLTSMSRSSAMLGNQPVAVTLTGTNFVGQVTINAGSGISVTNTTVVNTGQITATFTLNSPQIGANAITVTTPGGTSGSLPFYIDPIPTVTQSNPGSASQTLTFTFTDMRGVADLASVQALIGTSTQSSSSCYVWVNPNANTWPAGVIWLNNDAGNSWGSYYALGTSGTISNSQCSIDLGASSATANGTTYTLRLAVTYTSPSTAASENIYGTMTDASGDPFAWQQLGVWTMPIPAITNISPGSGVIGSSVTITGTNFGTSQLGAVTFNNRVIASPTTWSPTSITVPVPTGATTGNVVVTELGLASNGVNFTVTNIPQYTSLSPTAGTGLPQIFALTYSEAVGYTDIAEVDFLVQTALTPAGACDLKWTPSSNSFYLMSDGGTTWLGPISGGTGNSLSNSQCTLSGGASTSTGNGNSLTISFGLTFSAAFSGNKNLYVQATGSGGVQTWQQEGTWTVAANTVSAPVFTPAPGPFTGAQSVAITSSTPGAKIYYTTDNTTPSETNGSLYSSAVYVNATETLMAIAHEAGWADSSLTMGTYTISTPAATPTMTPAPGKYAAVQTVTIATSTPGATIMYTTDTSQPTEAHGTPLFGSGQISVSASETIQAMAFGGGFADSTVVTGAYTITPGVDPSLSKEYVYMGERVIAIENTAQSNTVSPPQFSPAGGTFTSAQNVMVTCPTAGSSVHYTTDGTNPTQTSASVACNQTISVQSSEPLTAIAWVTAPGWNPSSPTRAVFTIQTTTYSISGTVSGYSGCTSGVLMTLTGAAHASTQTNTSGGYSFSGLAPGGYTVTPSFGSCSFSPASMPVTITNSNAAASFSALSYSLSGTVSGYSGCISGVAITLSGAVQGFAQTSASGSYFFGGLGPGSYTVTPSLASCSFSPASLPVTISNSNATASFTAAPSSPQLSISPGTLQAGIGQWTLTLYSNIGNTPFQVCSQVGSGPWVCQPYAATDGNGNWTHTGFAPEGQSGTWHEYVLFPNNITSNTITFTVSDWATLTISPQGSLSVGETWTLTLQSSIHSTSFGICVVISGGSLVCPSNYGATDSTGYWSLSGVVPNQTGTWQEWIVFPTINSNTITFTVNP
jgi:hypothetical protein